MDIPHETTPVTPPAANNNASEGDEKDRSRKDNRGGLGHSLRRQMARLRQALLNAVSEEDIKDIIDALKGNAKEGDVAASKLLFCFRAVKPPVPPT